MRRRFTLIELLVVVAILSILASILLPALQKATAKSKKVACLNSISQFLVAESIYHSDNDGYIILSQYYRWGSSQRLGSWAGYLASHREEFADLSGILVCPSYEGASVETSYARNQMVKYTVGGDGYWVQFQQTVQWPRVGRLNSPSQLLSWVCSDAYKADIWSWKPEAMHENATGTVAGYFDGHAEADQISAFLQGAGLPWNE